ncbi:piRNA biogenesis protein EXD1-like isoform X2 [Rana temporaria]|uniref:piRNA biogenesis protein EXD1-like isoform X2 n=1 Tax=Rana temporaria TaxID=8407 RepID=UPI001AAC95ED|nr:piRNA biogenesis protein EXD1-like isoform X2 [Rana temporaria]
MMAHGTEPGTIASWICEQEQKIDYIALRRYLGKPIIITLSNATYQGDLIHIDHSRSLMLSKVDMRVDKENHAIAEAREQQPANRERGQEAEENFSESKMEELMAALEWRDIKTPSQDPEITKEFQPKSKGRDAIHTRLKIIERAVEKVDINFTVIDQLQVTCNLAISHLRCQTDIGLAAAGSNLCRHESLCWLQVASKSHVYMFDIATLGLNVFKCGLKGVLEDENIVKVIHDCRGLSDCLYHKYGVEVSNVFDTQVADIFLFQKETGGLLPQCPSTLEECLTKRLNLPSSQISFLSHSQGIMKDNNPLWSLCIIPLPLQKALVLEASYVLSLRTPMINAMMADFFSLVNSSIKVYTQSNENVPNWTQLSKSRLSEDFQMLKDLQEKRREKALKKYAAGDNGLLLSPGNQQQVPKCGNGPENNEKSILPISDKDRSAVCTERAQVQTEPESQAPPVGQMHPSPPCLAALNLSSLRFPILQIPRTPGPLASTVIPHVRMSAAWHN